MDQTLQRRGLMSAHLSAAMWHTPGLLIPIIQSLQRLKIRHLMKMAQQLVNLRITLCKLDALCLSQCNYLFLKSIDNRKNPVTLCSDIPP